MRFIKDIGSLMDMGRVRLFNERRPVSVTFISTYRCNFRCGYCGTWEKTADELSTPEVFSMIDELTRNGMRRFGLNGGEPLLRADIQEIIAYAKDKGLTVTLFSNGWLVKDNIDKLKRLDVLLMSFDGPAHIHDAQRQAGSYAKVLDALRAAREAGIKVWTNTVISKNNLEHLDFIMDKAGEFGALATFQPVYFYAHSSPRDDIVSLLPVKAEYMHAIDNVIKRARAGGPVAHSIRYLEYIKNPDWSKNKRRCWAGRFYFAITPDGCVAPCYPVFASGSWPNGRELGYKKAIDSLGNFACGGCFCILAENDFFFSLKPDVVLKMIRQI